MLLITNTKELEKACLKLSKSKVITVDTEFIRERTYWAKLCLIQVATPNEEFIIDPLAENIDLKAFYKVMLDKKVLKVFHACRQDMEIFYKELEGKLPTPIFDTQIAAMVCGHGEQVSYENLVQSITKKHIDKSSRFTNWAQRPLTAKQLEYAASDVTHLRDVYKKLSKELDKKKRKTWIKDEMKVLTSKETYEPDIKDAWKRVKINTNDSKALGILQELAAWREIAAQEADIPRGRMMRDEVLANIALNPPKDQKSLANMRGLPGSFAENKVGYDIMEAVKRGQKLKKKELPARKKHTQMPAGLKPSVELLKVLLKMKSEEHDVAHRMIASNEDLDQIAAFGKDAEVEAMSGWRYKVFGEPAMQLLEGKIAFGIEDKKIILLDIVRE